MSGTREEVARAHHLKYSTMGLMARDSVRVRRVQHQDFLWTQGHRVKLCSGCLREDGRALLEKLGTAIVQRSLNKAGFSHQSPHECLLLKGNQALLPGHLRRIHTPYNRRRKERWNLKGRSLQIVQRDRAPLVSEEPTNVRQVNGGKFDRDKNY